MENNGSASLFRNRRLESFLGTSCGQIARETPPNVLAKEAAEQRRKPEDYDANADNDGGFRRRYRLLELSHVL